MRLIRVVEPSYEFFDHTADMGIRVRAATPPDLLSPAGDALYAAIGQLVAGGDATTVSINLTAETPPDLLRDYLSELLVLFDRDRRMVTQVDVAKYTRNHLTATIRTCAVDEERSVLHREVKAVTYHELGIKEVAGGYEATFIVDI